MRQTIYALPGFLGLPTDWDRFRPLVTPHNAFTFFSPDGGLPEAARALNRWVSQQKGAKPILLGYSQGGRLALHALIDDPSLWAGAIIVSAHTGLLSPEEKANRLQADAKWAERFLNGPWDRLMHDWERQDVFKDGLAFQRNESDYSRAILAKVISEWSLGKQDDLSSVLSQLSVPILWIAGERDEKYVQIAQQMAHCHRHSSCQIIPGVGHRVPWEAPSLFMQVLKDI